MSNASGAASIDAATAALYSVLNAAALLPDKLPNAAALLPDKVVIADAFVATAPLLRPVTKLKLKPLFVYELILKMLLILLLYVLNYLM